VVAFTLGARIIEQHFTMNRALKGTDQAFSLEPSGLRKLRRDLDRAHEALGDGVKKVYPSEYGPIAKMRRWLIRGKWQIGTKAEQESGVVV
jgi:N-acetylneuraminate synthase/sialic acid synthase